MSRYEWEKGTIKLPSAEYAKFRQDVIKKHNELLEQRYQIACQVRDELLKAGKGLRTFDWESAFDRQMERRHVEDEERWEIQRLIWRNEHGGASKIQRPGNKPQKKWLDTKPVSKECSLRCGEASITFNNKQRTVAWNVPEQNHGCESARAMPLAVYFFRRLGEVKWTRGSGGKIVGNDEYNRDEGGEYEGGGGSYVTSEFGPNVKKKTSPGRVSSFAPMSYGRRWF